MSLGAFPRGVDTDCAQMLPVFSVLERHPLALGYFGTLAALSAEAVAQFQQADVVLSVGIRAVGLAIGALTLSLTWKRWNESRKADAVRAKGRLCAKTVTIKALAPDMVMEVRRRVAVGEVFDTDEVSAAWLCASGKGERVSREVGELVSTK